MTTGELIKLLQEADPTGALPVCVDNHAITYVTRAEAYYDGSLQQIDRNPDRARIVRTGDKVRIYFESIEEWLFRHPEAPVEIIGHDHYGHHAQSVEAWRAEARQFRKECPEYP